MSNEPAFIATTTTKPADEQHVTIAKATNDRDYMVVAGTSHIKWFYDQDVIPGLRGKNNKTSFLNQGIRRLRQYKESIDRLPEKERSFHRKYFIVFTEEYDRKLLNELKIIVEGYGASYHEINATKDLMPFLNKTSGKRKSWRTYIKELAIFSHGYPSHFAFGLATDVDKTTQLGAQHVLGDTGGLKPEVFSDDAEIFCYACRTGIGMNYEKDGKFDKEGSLAQLMANEADTIVWAYARRSEYAFTNGLKDENLAGEKARKKIPEYEKAMKKYQEEANKAAKAGKPAPTPPKREDYFTDKDYETAQHIIGREENKKNLDYPLDPLGAVRPVSAGETPEEVPATFFKFLPKT